MERILLINGISPYLYCLAVKLLQPDAETYKVLMIIFLLQLVLTIVLSIVCKDKGKLARITMLNKFIQIPYFVGFFVYSVLSFIVGMAIMGLGLLLLPFLIAIDFGVFLSTLIPEEICTIKLKMTGRISTGRFILYFIANAFYMIDIVFSVLIYCEYKKEST